jgi:outer membrane protein OmpA-like peptidoglycan-associated protein
VGILRPPARLRPALAVTVLAAAGPAIAQRSSFEAGAFGALASFSPRFDLRMGLAGGGRFGFSPRPGWSLELELGAGSATVAGGGRSIPLTAIGLHALRELDADHRRWFALAGYARPGFHGTPPGRFSDDAIALGLGHRAALGARLALRTELRGQYAFSSTLDGRGSGQVLALVGLSFSPGAHSAADLDTDGIPDTRDACRRTPDGAIVDARGCPADSDGDGHFDGLDRCPNTPAGALTEATGCPVDSDRDGVYDGADQCPNSPTGSGVDARGCLLDVDGDGVTDANDRCPGTPAHAAVNASGCPVSRDADGDGVDDARDRCPGTTAGTPVDTLGCQVLFTREREALVLQGVNFESGSARLLPTSYTVLDQVAASLLAHPDVRIEIAGYTDSTGSVRTNTRLSAERARTVQDYLEQRGVAAARMRAAGYGPADPVASNATPAGRARNRRVELRQVP